jgi:hypothetical protein
MITTELTKLEKEECYRKRWKKSRLLESFDLLRGGNKRSMRGGNRRSSAFKMSRWMKWMANRKRAGHVGNPVRT